MAKGGSQLSIFGDLWTFMRVRKKWWLGSDPAHDAAALGLIVLDPGIRRRAFHLRAVLGGHDGVHGQAGDARSLGILGELWTFMRQRKKWWLAPIVVTMVLLSS